ncbi:MAG: alpha-L-rhamnosidase, partial [Bacteroidota bacterium]
MLVAPLGAQDYAHQPWPASWVTHPTAPATEFAVVNFRRTFRLEVLPDSLPVMVSADNRYQLFVNGQRVGEGPARGDLLHWRYETYDLKPYLQTGDNLIAAVVWNYGIDKPWSQQSYRLGFLLQLKDEAFHYLQTNEDWLAYHNEAYSPITDSKDRLGTYIVVGPQLRIDGNKMPWSWEQGGFVDDAWSPAKTIVKAAPAGVGTEFYWGLVARGIPHFRRKQLDQPIPTSKGFQGYVPPNTKRSLQLRFRNLENAFFTYRFARGKGAKVRVEYAESLFDQDGNKGNRDEYRNKKMLGIYDEFLLDGATRDYATPWFRTARYLELTITTQEDTVFIEDILAEEFAYPFTPVAGFVEPENAHRTKEIWTVGWRTARLCAQETYVDCPYYEQLQYVGDTRIQALISLYVSGDDRLMRKAIQVFDESRTSDGLTASRYPSNVPQIIPPYSLAWVEMVGDYWMHRPDTTFVRERLRGVRSVLDWYDRQALPNGLIGPTPYWNFVDWADEWPWDPIHRIGGVPDMEGGSSIISLQYLSALRTAAKLHTYFGDDRQAMVYRRRAERVATAVRDLCWQAERGLFSDTPKGEVFSQHANILALLTDLAPAAAPEILTKVLDNPSL